MFKHFLYLQESPQGKASLQDKMSDSPDEKGNKLGNLSGNFTVNIFFSTFWSQAPYAMTWNIFIGQAMSLFPFCYISIAIPSCRFCALFELFLQKVCPVLSPRIQGYIYPLLAQLSVSYEPYQTMIFLHNTWFQDFKVSKGNMEPKDCQPEPKKNIIYSKTNFDCFIHPRILNYSLIPAVSV